MSVSDNQDDVRQVNSPTVTWQDLQPRKSESPPPPPGNSIDEPEVQRLSRRLSRRSQNGKNVPDPELIRRIFIDDNLQPRKDQNAESFYQNAASMLDNGWCPHQVYYLAQHDTATFAALAKLGPIQNSNDHGDCADKPACIAYNASMSNYVSRHVSEDCTCNMVAVPYDELLDVIRRGDIPLITIENVVIPVAKIKLRVQKRVRSSKYVAISHVWVHGLGNPNENSLPECQLRKLQKQLHQIQGSFSTAFWFDTLCIPVKPEDEKFRAVSLDMMASIYQRAEQILVLDAGLMSLRGMEEASDYLTRILSSAWMYRSWTLQEGALARECVFQFGDQILVAVNSQEEGIRDWYYLGQDRELQPLDLRPTDSIQPTVPYHLLHDIFGHREPSYDIHERFIYAWNVLSGRSTTKATDECLILGNVLDFDCHKLYKKAPDDRIPSIVLSLDLLPFSLFFNTGKRLDRPEQPLNCWLPTELSRDILTDNVFMRRSRGELKLVNSVWAGYGGPSIYIIDDIIPQDLTYFVMRERARNTALTFRTFPKKASQLDLSGLYHTCIFTENSQPSLLHRKRAAIFYVRKWTEGVQVDRLSLIFHCPARFEELGSDSPSMYRLYHGRLYTRTCDVSIKYDSRPSMGKLPLRINPSHYQKRMESLKVVYYCYCFFIYCSDILYAYYAAAGSESIWPGVHTGLIVFNAWLLLMPIVAMVHLFLKKRFVPWLYDLSFSFNRDASRLKRWLSLWHSLPPRAFIRLPRSRSRSRRNVAPFRIRTEQDGLEMSHTQWYSGV